VLTYRTISYWLPTVPGAIDGAPQVRHARRVAYWPAQLWVLAAILLQVGLSRRLTAGPRWLLPAL